MKKRTKEEIRQQIILEKKKDRLFMLQLQMEIVQNSMRAIKDEIAAIQTNEELK